MSSSAQKLPNEPIILRILDADVTTEADQKAEMLADLQLIETQREPVFLIIDFLRSPIPESLDDVMIASDLSTRQMSLFVHPNIRRVIFVTVNPMLELAAKGLDTEIYGFVKIKVFHTREEALAYARSER
ncbi:MAG: hypothetical protein U0670_10535 [Anaerolineae bacterium]